MACANVFPKNVLIDAKLKMHILAFLFICNGASAQFDSLNLIISDMDSPTPPITRLDMGVNFGFEPSPILGDKTQIVTKAFIINSMKGKAHCLIAGPEFDSVADGVDLDFNSLFSIYLIPTFSGAIRSTKFRSLPSWVANARNLKVLRLDFISLQEKSMFSKIRASALILNNCDPPLSSDDVALFPNLKFLVLDRSIKNRSLSKGCEKLGIRVYDEAKFHKLINSGKLLIPAGTDY